MLETEAFSVAARLYVALRQKLGRITDVQWMLENSEYAEEVIRIAREQTGTELSGLADRFEVILTAKNVHAQAALRSAPVSQFPREPELPGHEAAAPAQATANEGIAPRYVGRLR